MGLASGRDVTATQHARIKLMHAKTAQKRRRIKRRYRKDQKRNILRTSNIDSSDQGASTYAWVQDQQNANDGTHSSEELIREVKPLDDGCLSVDLGHDVFEEIMAKVRERL